MRTSYRVFFAHDSDRYPSAQAHCNTHTSLVQLLRAPNGIEEVDPRFPMELHAIRLADIVLATNPFELFPDYGMRIEARGPALQTFVVQLAGNRGLYLPTARALEGFSIRL